MERNVILPTEVKAGVPQKSVRPRNEKGMVMEVTRYLDERREHEVGAENTEV